MKIIKSIVPVVAVLSGSFLTAIAINGFFLPHKLLSGGVSGIAILLHYILNIPTGLLIILINVPIFFIGYKFLDKPFLISSALGMSALAVFLFITKDLQNMNLLDDIFLSALFGGTLSGMGMGFVFKNRGSLGGTDIVAVILRRYLSLNIGTVLFSFNIVIVLFSSVLFGLKPAIYTLISMYLSSSVLDYVQLGFERKKAVFIISDLHEKIASHILSELGRGVTFFTGEGGYGHKSKKVIYTVISLTQLAKVKAVVEKVDNEAFMIVTDAAEVLGRGFNPYE